MGLIIDIYKYMFFVVRSNDSFNFLLGLIKYIAIVIVIIIIMLIVINVSIITILHPATPAMRNFSLVTTWAMGI